VLIPMEWNKTAGKQFRHRLAGREPRQHVSATMLKNKNPRQRRAPRRSIRRLAMPRRPVHPHFLFLVILSGAAVRRSRAVAQSKDPALAGGAGGPKRSFNSGTIFIPPNDNPVVAQHLNVLARRPQPRRRTLPRPGMTDKQTPRPIR